MQFAFQLTPAINEWMTATSHKISRMNKVLPVLSFCLASALSVAFAEPYDYPNVHLHDLPGPLQEAYRNEKPNLGDIGRCVVSYDSSTDQEKMIFTCSIYVKMSAVAERKAMERCEQMKDKRRIKGPCRVIKE
jgi:hypothetical protein